MTIKISKMALTLITAAALIMLCIAGGALAFLVGDTDPVTNTFIAGSVDCEVVQNEQSTSATVKNTGNVRAYIRATVVGNTLNEEGQITGNWTGNVRDQYLDTTEWVPVYNEESGVTYYYYNGGAIEPQAFTPDLFKSNAPAPLDDLLITVFAEAIQADGMPDVANAQQAFAYAKAN